MARSHQSLSRRERERAKKQKADDKRQRRLAKPDPEAVDPSGETGELDGAVEPVEPVDESDILRKLADLNAAFDAGDLEFEDFDEQRTALLSALTIE
jgi:hypothetical protein